MADDLPVISVIIPARNAERELSECLRRVLEQDYPGERVEVLIAEGCSTDRTRAIAEQAAATDPRVRVVDNPTGLIPQGLNLAIAQACGEVIARVDAHSRIAPDYLSQCVRVLRETGAGNAGGPVRPRGEGYWGEAIAVSYGSWFGRGGARLHDPSYRGEADTVYLGCFPKALLIELGGFDETLSKNQDIELNHRIIESGRRVFLAPEIKAEYVVRSSLRALWRYHFDTGWWNIISWKRHPGSLSARHFAPLAFVLALIAAVIWAVLSPLGRQVLGGFG